MKPLPIPLITLTIILGTIMGYSAFAYEVATNSNGLAYCYGYTAIDGYAKNLQIYSEPEVHFRNVRNVPQNISYTFSMCTAENHVCAPAFTKYISLPPNGGMYDHAYRLILTDNFNRVGDHHYTVAVDIHGDIEEHTEKDCIVRTRKG